MSVCIEKYYCGASHLHINPKMHVCAFVHVETDLTECKFSLPVSTTSISLVTTAAVPIQCSLNILKPPNDASRI